MVDGGIQKNWCPQLFVNGLCQFQRHLVEIEISLLIVLVAEQKPTKNGQKRVEAERSTGRYYQEYPVAYGPKREKVSASQSDTANNTLYRYCF